MTCPWPWKAAYPRRGQALLVLTRLPRKARLVAYQCQAGHWHLGHETIGASR